MKYIELPVMWQTDENEDFDFENYSNAESGIIYLTPDHIICIEPKKKGFTVIRTAGGDFGIPYDYEYLVRLINLS